LTWIVLFAAVRAPLLAGASVLISRGFDPERTLARLADPAEVEAVLCELEAVVEAAVIGIADERWGEVGRAYIVVAPGRILDTEAVLQHCRGRLAKFKMPASVVLVDSIPRTASGKILRSALQTRAKDEIARRRLTAP
jgi:acyl-CoA synthetase (AMP-forming)/AMP-acid ligase II